MVVTKVQFARTARVVIVRCLDDFTDEEFEDIWFSEEECAGFRRRERRLSSQLDTITSGKNDNKMAEMGVRTKADIGKRRSRIRATQLCVFNSQYSEQHQQDEEQNNNKNTNSKAKNGQTKEENLAKLCALTSLEASIDALERGQQLAASVRHEENSPTHRIMKLSTTAKRLRQAVMKRGPSFFQPPKSGPVS